MNTNEPTTGEIVRALGISAEKNGTRKNICDEAIAADRLESQERSIEEAAKLIEKQANTIAFHERDKELMESNHRIEVSALTARAESAERERDAAIKALTTYEDALFDERDIAYNRGYSDGHRDGNSEQ